MNWLVRAIGLLILSISVPIAKSHAQTTVSNTVKREELHSWGRAHLASIVSGRDVNEKEVQHRLYLLAVSSASLHERLKTKRKDDDLKACLEEGLLNAAEQFREIIPQLRYPTAPPAEKDATKKAEQARDFVTALDSPTTAVVLGVVDSLREYVRKACSAVAGELSGKDIQLAFVDRVCVADSIRCARVPHPRKPITDQEAQVVFGRLARWVLIRRGNADWRSNVVWIVDDASSASNVEALLALSGEETDWPGTKEMEVARKELVAWVEFLRKKDRISRVPDIVPTLVQLRMSDLQRIADVVSDPISAQTLLASRPAGSGPEIEIDDEPARSRIRECSRYLSSNEYFASSVGRDVSKNVDAVSSCAGIVATGADSHAKAKMLLDCITGGACRPKAADMVEIRAVAGAMALPRLTTFEKGANLEQRGSECGLTQRARGDASNMDAASDCLLAVATKEVRDIYACARKTDISEKVKFECMNGNATRSVAAECMLDPGKNNASKLECALLAAPPPTLAMTIGCRTHQDPQKCLTDKLNEAVTSKMLAALPSDYQRAAQCYSASTGATETARCIFKDQLPAEIAVSLNCGSKANLQDAAVCMLASSTGVPRDVQKAAMCLSESQGNPMGAGVCMISDGLTPEQRIAMQCAVASGGVPAGFATCALGQLAMKELAQCANARFGEGPCFGENNEIRKVLRAIGIDVKPGTVVNDLANASLVPVKVVVAFIQSPEKGVQMAAQEVSGAVSRATSDVGDGVQKIVKEVGGLVNPGSSGEGAKVVRLFTSALPKKPPW